MTRHDNEPDLPPRTSNGGPDHEPGRPDPGEKARAAMGDRLEDTAGRVREIGDRAAEKNRLLAPTRPLAYDAARSIDNAADYVRTRQLGEMRNDLETQVRRHPLASVAVAFLAGYAVRRIFS